MKTKEDEGDLKELEKEFDKIINKPSLNKVEKKPLYPFKSVCNFCKFDKLSEEEIDDIQLTYDFLDACQGCKLNYKLSNISFGLDY